MRRLAFLVALLITGSANASDTLRAALDCGPTPTRLDYLCRITLTDPGGRPVSGAKMLVGADMPSMPMMHHIRPVAAAATENPGEYTALLKLEMFGVWAVSLDVSAPHRQRIVIKREFTREP